MPMVPLILTTALIQWFIPIKLDLNKQARVEKVFRANDWSMYHWPLLNKDSSAGGQLFSVEGVLAWKKMAINYLGMDFLADLVRLETDNLNSTFKGDLQLAATFKNLRMLSIDFARIAPPDSAPSECIHLAFLRSFKELRILDLNCYQKEDLNALFKDSQKDFPFLKVLYLSHCPNLRGEIIPGIFSCPNLLSLDISECDLKTIPKMDATKPFKLKHLTLNCKTLDNTIWDYIANCPDLEELSIDYPDFTGKELAKLTGLQRLIKLKIYSIALTNQDLAQLVPFKKLNSLKIGGPKLTNQGVRHLVHHGDLEVLTLKGAGFTDGCLTDLKNFKNLRNITLLSTGITTEGQDFLKNLSDKVEIYTKIDFEFGCLDDFINESDFPPLFHFGCLYRSPAKAK